MADQDILHTADLMKAALPYIDTRSKTMAELFVKVFDLMGSVKMMKSSSNLAACGFEAGKFDLEGLLNGIRPICSLREIVIVDQVLNIFKMKRMFEMYNNLMETMKTMQEFGDFSFQDAGTGTDTDTVTGNFKGAGFESIFQNLKNFTSKETSEGSSEDLSGEAGEDNAKGTFRETFEDTLRDTSEGTAEGTSGEHSGGSGDKPRDTGNTGKGNNDMMFEMLKTMIPPDKVSTFENLSMLLNTMSYDNNSKPEQKESSDV